MSEEAQVPLSLVPIPVVDPETRLLRPYDRRDPAGYTEEEQQQVFMALASRLIRLRQQRRTDAGMDGVIIAAAISPTTTDDEVKALALVRFRNRYQADGLGPQAYALDPDVHTRWNYLLKCFEINRDEDENKSPNAIDAIRSYWEFPDHYLTLLHGAAGAEQRVQELTEQLSTARQTAAELSRQALELTAEAGALKAALSDVSNADATPAVVIAREQIVELSQEVNRLTASAQDYRDRAAVLLDTLNAVKPGYENHDGRPTARTVLRLDIQRQVHDRDGGRCVRCGSTFKLQVDHVVPLNRGGSNDVNNLQVLCMACNTSKGNRYVG